MQNIDNEGRIGETIGTELMEINTKEYANENYDNLPDQFAGNRDNRQSSCLSTVFLDFAAWQKTVDGGKKFTNSAKQHASQVAAVANQLGTGNVINNLGNKELLKTKFINTFVVDKEYRIATIKSYLSSIKHFYTYIINNNITAEKQQVIQMTECLNRWIQSLRNDGMKQELQKKDIDMAKLVSPEEVQRFDSSEPALCAVKILGEVNNDQMVSQHQYVLVIDYIITQIMFSNANRSGVLANMTMGEYNASKLVNGYQVISVQRHKTAALYESAKIVLTLTLHSWLKLFIDHVRVNVVQCDNEECLYLLRG